MGKNKGSNQEPCSDAYQRINFLFQASETLKNVTKLDSPLPAYFSNLAKEVTKKIVGRIHPDIKREFCNACSHPILSAQDNCHAAIIPFKKRRNKKKNDKIKAKSDQQKRKIKARYEEKCNRVSKRKKHPNSVLWKCLKCGYLKSQLQRPDYSIWINSNASQSS